MRKPASPQTDRIQGRACLLSALLGASTLFSLARVDRAATIEVSVVAPITARKVAGATALGTVETPDHVILAAPFDGVVTAVRVRSGDATRAGRILLRIQPFTLAARVQAATAAVAAANAYLAQQNILAEQKLVTAAALQTARARLAARAAALAGLQAHFRLRLVRAPFAGTVRGVAAVGSRVLQGQHLLRIDGNGALRIEAAFPMAVVQGLRAGVTMTVIADGDSGTGRIYSVAQTADHYGLVSVYLTPSPKLRLMPGEVVRVRSDTAVARAWRVPQAAVVLRGTTARVYVDQGGRARAVMVKLLAVGVVDSVVLGDLRPDSRVIVSDAAWLRNGTPVTRRRAGPEP